MLVWKQGSVGPWQCACSVSAKTHRHFMVSIPPLQASQSWAHCALGRVVITLTPLNRKAHWRGVSHWKANRQIYNLSFYSDLSLTPRWITDVCFRYSCITPNRWVGNSVPVDNFLLRLDLPIWMRDLRLCNLIKSNLQADVFSFGVSPSNSFHAVHPCCGIRRQ